MSGYPRRIVCLTEETTETLYLLGEGDRVVGISGYTVRPPEARQKPKVSSFLHARYEKIEALKPDLILAFSDLQADITNDLVKRGYPVFTFNQRSVAEILQMIRVLGGIVGVPGKAEALATTLQRGLDDIREQAATLPWRPKVFFEEWYDPLISGIRWTEELVEIAGGDPIFPELREARPCKGSHRHRRAGDRARARRDHRIVVRQARAQGAHCRAARVARGPGRQERTDLRSEIHLHPAAGTRRTHRGRRAARHDHRGGSGRPCCSSLIIRSSPVTSQ